MMPDKPPIVKRNTTAIEYNIICEGTGAANGLSQFGNFGSTAAPATTVTSTVASQLGTAGPAVTINPGATYTVIITPTANCAPQALASDTLVVQAGAGGFTYEVLKYGATTVAGDVVV